MLFSLQTFLVAGISRSGVSAAEYLRARGAKVYLYDDVEDGAVDEAARRLEALGCERLSGEERLKEGMRDCDVLVLSPGIPVDHPLPVAFRHAGKRVIGELELGALALRAPAVAVTGTNGKTTTVTLIDEILRADGKKSWGRTGSPSWKFPPFSWKRSVLSDRMSPSF